MSLCVSGTHVAEENSLQDRFLEQVYGHTMGRILIRPFLHPAVSKAVGRVLDSRISGKFVPLFLSHHPEISLDECEKKEFSSFNDFFTRRLNREARTVDDHPEALISPCDARLMIFPIKEDGRFRIKQTSYSLKELLKDKKLAERFLGGTLYLFRLSVDDYHRYIYVDGGICSPERNIKGILHTVNPAANDRVPVYKENTREYMVQKSDHFGTFLQMEVGAMMVGKICNPNGKIAGFRVQKGEEKGYFAFGGSTIVLITEPGKVEPDRRILAFSSLGIETKVRQGERVGTAC